MATQLKHQITGKGKPIVFIHGFSLDSQMWQPQVEYFSQTNQVITYDLRGFGQSPLPDKVYSHHEDLHELLTEVGIEKPHLVGLSLGGEIAIDYTLAYSNEVTSLTLADSSLGGYASTVDWRVYAKEQGLEQAKANWLNHQVFSSAKSKPGVYVELKEMVNAYSGWHWLNSDPRVKLDPPAIKRLQEISVTTKVIVGEQDLSYYHDIAKILSDQIPSSKLHKIPNAGHMVNLEQPDTLNKILEEVIK